MPNKYLGGRRFCLIALAAVVLGATGCVSTFKNMCKPGNQRVMVVDAESGAAVPGMSLFYAAVRKPYFIVGAVEMSCPYVSDEGGIAFVPKSEFARLSPGGASYRRVSVMEVDARVVCKGRVVYLKKVPGVGQ